MLPGVGPGRGVAVLPPGGGIRKEVWSCCLGRGLGGAAQGGAWEGRGHAAPRGGLGGAWPCYPQG